MLASSPVSRRECLRSPACHRIERTERRTRWRCGASAKLAIPTNPSENETCRPAFEIAKDEADLSWRSMVAELREGRTDRERSGRGECNMLEDRFLKRLKKKARKGCRGWPIATIAFYGPNLSQATKVAVGIVPSEE